MVFQIPRKSPLLALTLVVWGTFGCSPSVERVVHSSLDDLTFATRRSAGDVFVSTELLSVHGLLPTPGVGLTYHDADASRLLPLSRDHSYMLVGEEAKSPGDDDVAALQQRVVEIRSVLTQIRKNFEDAVLSAAAALRDADSAKSVLDAIRDHREQSVALQEQLEALTQEPGVLILRWNSTFGDGPPRRGSTTEVLESQGRRSGYVVLGGVRILSLTVGEDLQQRLTGLPASDARLLERAALPNYALQSQTVAYVADSADLTRSYFRLVLGESGLPESDQLAVSVAFSRLQEVGDRGTFGPLTWSKQPFCFVAGPDLWTGVGGEESLNDGWKTVTVNLVHLGRMKRLLDEVRRDQVDGTTLGPPAPRAFSCSPDQCGRYPQIQSPEYRRQQRDRYVKR